MCRNNPILSSSENKNHPQTQQLCNRKASIKKKNIFKVEINICNKKCSFYLDRLNNL